MFKGVFLLIFKILKKIIFVLIFFKGVFVNVYKIKKGRYLYLFVCVFGSVF